MTLLAAALLAALAATVANAADAATWCGTSTTALDRQPDAVSAFQFHVVLAYPADGTDPTAQLASPIASDIETITNWWIGQDPTREPRFDFFAFPGCPSPAGDLDLSSVRLPHDSAYYVGEIERYDRIRIDLDSLGFSDPDKKYLVYYDGPTAQPTSLCGQSDTDLADTGGPRAYSIVYLAGQCGLGLGQGGVATVVAVHELIHGLGALPAGAPHACPGDDAHPCDSPNDILYPSQNTSVTLSHLVLDYGRDDYYGHGGSWYDIRNSLFLAHMDTPDELSPVGPAALKARKATGAVRLSWPAAAGSVAYRLYRNGALVGTTRGLSARFAGRPGQTLLLSVRAQGRDGLLGPRLSVRVTLTRAVG